MPDVGRAYEPIIERFVAGPHTEDGIRAAVVIGSGARTDHPADEWADLDIVIWSRAWIWRRGKRRLSPARSR